MDSVDCDDDDDDDDDDGDDDDDDGDNATARLLDTGSSRRAKTLTKHLW